MNSASKTSPSIFLLDDTILVLYSFLTNSESLKFQLVNKNVHYNLKLLPRRKSYSTKIGWKKHKNVVRALSIFSRFFPHSQKLVFTHFSSDDIDKDGDLDLVADGLFGELFNYDHDLLWWENNERK